MPSGVNALDLRNIIVELREILSLLLGLMPFSLGLGFVRLHQTILEGKIVKGSPATAPEKEANGKIAVAPPAPWANATPAGMVALAVACTGFFALLNGYLNNAHAIPLLGAWLLGGFVVQFTVAMIDFKGGNHTGGNTFLFFSAFFMLASGLEMIFKYNAIMAGDPLQSLLDGFVWCTLTVILWLWTPAFFAKFNLLSIIIVLLDIALPFVALNDLGVVTTVGPNIAAWAFLGAAAVAVYLGAATVVNDAMKKKVYPLP